MRKIENKETLREEYNGWSNWETWNVALWIQNDESAYRATKRAYSPENLEQIVMDIYPDGTPDMDSAKEMYDVDWEELFNEALDESNSNEEDPIEEDASTPENEESENELTEGTEESDEDEEIITVDRDAQINEEDALEPGDRIRIVKESTTK